MVIVTYIPFTAARGLSAGPSRSLLEQSHQALSHIARNFHPPMLSASHIVQSIMLMVVCCGPTIVVKDNCKPKT